MEAMASGIRASGVGPANVDGPPVPEDTGTAGGLSALALRGDSSVPKNVTITATLRGAAWRRIWMRLMGSFLRSGVFVAFVIGRLSGAAAC